MKKLLLIISALFILSGYIHGQAISGTNVAAPIVPFTPSDIIATHVDIYGQGGFRTVADIIERDTIRDLRRSEGMLVNVLSEDKFYTLEGGITNGDWVDITFATQADLQIHINNLSDPHEVSLEQARANDSTVSGGINMANHSLDSVGYIDFDINATPTHLEGRVHYSPADQTLEVGLPNGVVGQVFEEDFTDGQNDTGGTLGNGTVATYAGSIGNSGSFRINHTVASAAEHPLATVGIITADIPDGARGKVATRGKTRAMQTDGANYGEVWVAGFPVYKSSTVAGGLTNVPPQAPIPAIPLAVVISVHATNGTLFVRPTFPQSIKDLTDVNGTLTTTDGQILVWDNTREVFDFTHNINDYIPKTQNTVTNEPTGFKEPENVIITGNGDNTVTLTGTFNAYFEGELDTVIVSGWTSPAHGSDINEQYFLMNTGTTIEWALASSGFSEDLYKNMLIVFTFYDAVNGNWVYLREPHGLMPWQNHRADHALVGTYRRAGGTLSDYVELSTTPSDRRPSISACLLYDEDLPTINALLPEGSYTNFFLTGADGTINFNISQPDIVPLSANRPYFNEFTGGSWQQTLMSNNYFMALWVIAIPMCADVPSQHLRYIVIQGQREDNSLENIQSLTAADVSSGGLHALLPEFIGITKIIIKYSGGNWVIEEVTNLTGTSSSQVSSPSGNFLSSVSSDTTLTGLGTPSGLLGVNLNIIGHLSTKEELADTSALLRLDLQDNLIIKEVDMIVVDNNNITYSPDYQTAYVSGVSVSPSPDGVYSLVPNLFGCFDIPSGGVYEWVGRDNASNDNGLNYVVYFGIADEGSVPKVLVRNQDTRFNTPDFNIRTELSDVETWTSSNKVTLSSGLTTGMGTNTLNVTPLIGVDTVVIASIDSITSPNQLINAQGIKNALDSITVNGVTNQQLADSTSAIRSDIPESVLDLDVTSLGSAEIITTGERTIVSNTSGTNTGDQNISGKYDKTTMIPTIVNNSYTEHFLSKERTDGSQEMGMVSYGLSVWGFEIDNVEMMTISEDGVTINGNQAITGRISSGGTKAFGTGTFTSGTQTAGVNVLDFDGSNVNTFTSNAENGSSISYAISGDLVTVTISGGANASYSFNANVQ